MLFAQGLGGVDQILPLSPSAASAVQYGNVPVGTFTGVPNINIPLHEIETSFMTLPLALSYHAGGNRVETIASWVGMGWSLGTIPSISRSIQGLPDEDGYFNGNASGGKTLREVYDDFLAGTMTPGDYNLFLASAYEGAVDTQPDVFSYSIVGESGKFYYNQDAEKFITNPRTNTKIEFNGIGFTITSERGEVYRFDIEESTTTTGSSLEISSWYPSSIAAHHGQDSILFEYRSESTSFQSLNPLFKYIFQYSVDITPPPLGPLSSTTVVVGKKVSKISYDGGFIEFDHGAGGSDRDDLSGGYSLKSFSVNSLQNSLTEEVKKFEFTYDYLVGSGCTGLPDENKRWMILTKLDQISSVDTSRLTHEFTYKQNEIPPCRNSAAQDHWGYYNGKVANANLIPETVVFSNVISGADRTVDNQGKAEFGILKRITYPLGGYTDFTYENNRVNSNLADLSYVDNAVYLGRDSYTDPITEEDGIPPPGVIGQGTSLDPYKETFIISDSTANLLATGGTIVSIRAVAPDTCALSDGSSTTCATFRVVDVNNPSTIYYESIDRSYELDTGTYEIQVYFSPDVVPYDQFLFEVSWQDIDTTTVGQRLAGGLRVKEIESYTSASVLSSKRRYIYNDCFDCAEPVSSGEFFSGINRSYHDWFFHKDDQSETYYSYYRILSYSNVPQVSHNGGAVGYTTVYEVQEGGSETILKKIVHENAMDEIETPIVPYPPSTSQEARRGQIGAQSSFNEGDVLDLVQETNSSYQSKLFQGAFGIKWMKMGIPFENGSFLGPVSWPEYSEGYKLDAYNKNVSSSVETFHYPSGTQQTTKSYSYDTVSHHYLTKVETTDSDNRVRKTEYVYPPDYTSPDTTMSALVAKNRIAQPVETIQSIDGTVVSAQASEFDLTYLLPEKVYSYPKRDVATFAASTDGASFTSYELIATINRRNSKGDIEEYTRKDGVPVAIIWGYGGLYPVAEVVNATYTDFNGLGIINSTELDTGGLSEAQENSLRTNVSNALVTTFEYDQGVGLVKRTDPNGIKQTYSYDGFNRLQTVKDDDGNIEQLIDYQLGDSN